MQKLQIRTLRRRGLVDALVLTDSEGRMLGPQVEVEVVSRVGDQPYATVRFGLGDGSLALRGDLCAVVDGPGGAGAEPAPGG